MKISQRTCKYRPCYVSAALAAAFLLFNCSSQLLAQTEVKVWTSALAGNDYDYGSAVTVDFTGNVIMSGTTRSILGSMVNGRYDVFVAKYDASGNRIWIAQRGSDQQESGEGVVTDAAGNIYVTGYTGGNLDGNVNAGIDTWDIYLMKFDAAGNWLWTRQDGTSQDDVSHAIAIDSEGNVYITGYVRGNFHGNIRTGAADIFISKYDPAGNRLWSTLCGSTDVDEGMGIACDSSNNVYVTGYAQESVEGNTWMGTGDNILVKYNSNGDRQWLIQWGTSNADTGHAVTTDSSGNVYVTGYSNGQLYGPKNGGRDIFLAKFSSAGAPIWGRQMGTGETDQGYAIATDLSGNVYMAGETRGSLLGNTGAGESDVFFSKFSPTGTEVWTKQLGGLSTEMASGIAVDRSGAIYVSGWTTGDFEGYTNQGLTDAFLFKYAPSNSPPPAPTAHAATSVGVSGFTANWSRANWATGYRLDISTGSTFATYLVGFQDADVGDVLTLSVNGLSAGTTYYYRVRAYGTNGTSASSATITVSTRIPDCSPAVLLNGNFEGTTNTMGVGTNWVGYQRAPFPTTTTWKIQTAGPPPGGEIQYQQVANSSSTGGGGMRQDVTGCAIGATYVISGWMRGNSAFATCTVKVSPTASTNWATAIHLSPPQVYNGPNWTPFSGTVVATGTNITIWLDGQTTGTGNFNAECFDSVAINCPPQFMFQSIAALPPRDVTLVLSNAPYSSVTISHSSDLVNWAVLTNVTTSNGTARLYDPYGSVAGQRFYRATSP